MIAARRAEKRRLESNRRRLFYVILAEFCLVVAIVSCMAVRLLSLQIASSELSGKLQRLKNKVAEIQKLQDATNALQPKLTALNQSASTTLFWYTALQNVTASLPPSTYLTNIVSAGNAGSAPSPSPNPTAAVAKLNVLGQAASQFDVGAAMLRLDCYPDIQQVKLHSIAQVAGQSATGPSGVAFDMEVLLKAQVPASTGVGGNNVQRS
jgi:Tfp pilus assembly protein PilN